MKQIVCASLVAQLPFYMCFSGGSAGKEYACNAGDLGSIPQGRFLGLEESLEKEMTTHSSILAWRSPWTDGPGGLQSMGL